MRPQVRKTGESTMKKTLVLLAAGMGSRYGGLKQIDQLGPSGEALLEYSIFDALRAGFQKIVFIIRRDFADEFEKKIGSKFADFAEVDYCYQELNELPAGFQLPAERTKPWGTGHALLATKEVVQEPFLIINADDFYGPESFVMAAKMLDSWGETQKLKAGMIGFKLDQTLSEYGTVSRGISEVKDNKLVQVVETHGIHNTPEGIKDESANSLPNDAIASMNMWCLNPSIIREFEQSFISFLKDKIQVPKSEFYLPFVIDELVSNKELECEVVQSPCQWFGVTYKEDKELVVKSLQDAVADKVYPSCLADEFTCTI
jgi:UTP-glucose-1-phosphate uridylyltransferase